MPLAAEWATPSPPAPLLMRHIDYITTYFAELISRDQPSAITDIVTSFLPSLILESRLMMGFLYYFYQPLDSLRRFAKRRDQDLFLMLYRITLSAFVTPDHFEFDCRDKITAMHALCRASRHTPLTATTAFDISARYIFGHLYASSRARYSARASASFALSMP